jgi:Kef-type K+ transport system membrane component KefB
VKSFDPHALHAFWAQLLVLVASAHALGLLARRLGQPPVVGALAAGFLLGPSAFGIVAPGAFAWLFPGGVDEAQLLSGVAWVGVALLLVATGFETDLALVRRLGRAASFVASGSLLVPLATGIGVGLLLPDALLGPKAPREVFALFVGTALAISALPVIAAVLAELDLMRRNVGQITLAAATVNDVVGWILLGVVAGAAQSGSFAAGSLLWRLVVTVLFLAAAFGPGQRVVDAVFEDLRRRGGHVRAALAATLLLAFAGGVVTQSFGVEPIFGAFVAGVLCGRSKFQHPETFARIEAPMTAFFAPVFFASAGLRADLRGLADPTTLGWAAVVLAAASLSKFVGAFGGARLAGLGAREGFALGAALNARGAVELVIATVGLSAGVLNADSYTIVVLVALATSMMAPPLLRAAMAGGAGSAEERERLDRERLHGRSVLVRPHRVLLPTHGGPNSLLAARILDLAWPEGTEVAVLSAGADVPEDDLARVLAVFERKPVEHVHARGGDPLAAVLERAALGYGALVVGATERPVGGRLVSAFVDALLARSPIPVLLVRRARGGPERDVEGFRRILVPAVGTWPGRAAQEVACGIARRLDARVVLAHVVTSPAPGEEMAWSRRFWTRHPGDGVDPVDAAEAGVVTDPVALRVVNEAQSLAREMGVAAEHAIRIGVSVAGELLALSREASADLLVLPASVRQLSERPFLGYGVEHILEHGECAVVVVSVPPGWRG